MLPSGCQQNESNYLMHFYKNVLTKNPKQNKKNKKERHFILKYEPKGLVSALYYIHFTSDFQTNNTDWSDISSPKYYHKIITLKLTLKNLKKVRYLLKVEVNHSVTNSYFFTRMVSHNMKINILIIAIIEEHGNFSLWNWKSVTATIWPAVTQ